MSARAILLGTAQDGGYPHAGCDCAHCTAARDDPSLARLVSSLGLIGVSGKTLMVDASPDFSKQVSLLAREAGRPAPGLDELILTHAHVGHYLGLALLGREALSIQGLPLHVTASMARFLRENRPWSHLLERGEVTLRHLAPGRSMRFDGLRIQPFLSPHRGEDTDTIGIEIEGPKRTMLFVSDADYFAPALVQRIEEADVAVVDGTFYDRDEMQHRDIRQVQHPFVSESVNHLAKARGDVWFTHLNHTNALLDPKAPPRLPKPFGVAAEGQVFEL